MRRTTKARRLTRAVLALAVVATLAPSTSAGAQGDPYAADPLRLVPFADTVQRVYTQGDDVWEVWICRVPDWDIVLTVDQIVTDLTTTTTGFYDWLSGNQYHPHYVSGGEVTSDDVVPAERSPEERFTYPGCESEVAAATGGGANGAVIVVAGGFDQGYATAGAVCPEDPFVGCTTTYPANSRVAVLEAGVVTIVPPLTRPRWITAAHEIGHAINWGHSYGGLTFFPGTASVDKHDNPMDLMSGAIHEGTPIGTIAYQRYAAGWINPADVVIHASGAASYELAAIGTAGTQMLVVPMDEEGHFYALGARRRTDWDGSLLKAGVEVYEVDQRRSACSIPASWPATWPCFATLSRVAQTPAVNGIVGTAHVLSIDQEITLGTTTVRVTGANAGTFTVEVTDTPFGGRFVDDDGNPHEANIEAIASLGITLGCNPPLNDQYCPDRPVSRAEMAGFLIRAVDDEANIGPYQGIFSDVPDGLWYTGHVERLAALGITTGYPDGTYRPTALVSRAEMAAFLIRAVDDEANIGPYQGIFFDVPDGFWYTGHTELLYDLGITTGCASSPLAYCPDDQVLRDQMASFLARALGVGT